MGDLIQIVLLCTAFTMEPLFGTREGPFDARITIEENLEVQLDGFPNFRNFEATHAFVDGETFVITGAGTDMGIVAWARLEAGLEQYDLSLFIPGEWKVDGGYTIAQIGEGTCRIPDEGLAQ
jgi:hypothetical protein